MAAPTYGMMVILSLFFTPSHTHAPSAARLYAARENATKARSGGVLFMTARLRCDEDRLREKKEKKKGIREEGRNSKEEEIRTLIIISLCIPQASFAPRVISGRIKEDL